MYVHGEMLYAQFHNSASDLGNFTGMTYLNTGTTFVKYYNGSAWKILTTTDGAQVLTNKDYDGGTASNTSRLTVPKASFSTLSGLTRKQGTLVYDTDSNSLFVDDGSNLNQVGLGSGGGGGTEYISTGTGEFSTTGFATYADAAATTPVNGTGGAANCTFARTTSAGQFQRGDAGFIFSKGAANRQGEGFSFDFTIDPADENKVLPIEACIKFSSANYDGSTEKMVVYVYDVTNATLITPSVTDIAPTTADGYTFLSSFLTTTSNSYRLIFHVAGTGTTAWDMYVDSISVSSDGVIQSSGGTSGWQTYAPTITNLTLNATGKTDPTGKWRRVGTEMEVRIMWINGSGGAGSGGNIALGLPSGYTIDTSALHASGATKLGSALLFATNWDETAGVFYQNSSGLIRIAESGASTVFSGTDFAASSETYIDFTIPIAEWAGAGYVGIGEEEYAAVGGTWDADSSTTVFGPAGVLTGGALTDIRSKTVTWPTPVQATDFVVVEGSKDQVSWFPMNGCQLGSSNNVVANSYNAAGAPRSGVAWRPGAASNQTVVVFYQYMGLANDDAPGVDWANSASYWRVVKYKKGAPNGFSTGTSTNPGLLKKNRWQKKTLGSTITASTDPVTDLTFSNLTVGNIYRLTFQATITLKGTTATEVATLIANHNGSEIARLGMRGDSFTDWGQVSAGTSIIFVAAATSVTFAFNETGTQELGNGSTQAILEELNTHEAATTAWT